MMNIKLTGRQVGRVVGESPGNISIKARLQKWPGTSSFPWQIPARFVSKKYGIPVSEIESKLKADQEVMKEGRLSRKLERMAAKSKGGAR
jgi:hypothetical protein